MSYPTSLASLTRGEIMRLRDGYVALKGPSAANAFVQSTHGCLAWCLDRGLVQFNAAFKIKPLKGGHLPAWSDGEARFAMANFREPERRLVVLACHTGQRRGDLIRLRWRAFDGTRLTLKQSKTGTVLVIPGSPPLLAELASWKRDSVFMLTNAGGQPWADEYASDSVKREVDRLGLRPGLNIHGLRKLAAARLAEAGSSASEIASITGHKSLSMISLYTASARQELLAEAALDRLSQAPSQTGTNGVNMSVVRKLRG
jgi:integrase